MAEKRTSFLKSIGGKITIIFVLVVILSIGAVTFISVQQSGEALMGAQYSQLSAIREIKKGQIESYFAERRGDMNVLTSTVMTLRQGILKELEAVHSNKKNALEDSFSSSSLSREDINPDGAFKRTIDSIVGNRAGLGETGESYLVEAIGGKYYFRSDMETMGNGDFVFGYDVTAIAPSYLKQALQGNEGSDVFSDSSGKLVMVVYSPINIESFTFALVTKMDLEEAIVPTLEGRSNDFFTDYISEYGYYDLFLIHPEGDIFYTVAKEKDYQTNIINGIYADSSLGEAVQEAVETRKFAFGDFRPYAPSGDEPASFIAQPIVHGGNVELIIALQMPLDRINEIMQERTGMGRSGESYLVGPDMLMRSDSFLDPDNHSVIASFARPETGKVDTEASRAAVSGKTGAKIVIDYNGNPVLSAYTPVAIYDTSWALMSEIDEAEVREPINALTLFILISALVMIVIAITTAILFSKTISQPILLLVSGAQSLAIGDINLSGVNHTSFAAIQKRRDELGLIGRSFSNLIDYQREKAEIAQEIANKNLQVEASISSEQDTLGISFQEMVKALNELLGQVNSAVEQVNSGADQVSQASQNLSQGATEQASSLEEITSSITEINSQSKQNAENATEAHGIAKKATDDAVAGNSQMQELTEIMERINASSEQINKVVKVIDDIAFQINLLALNANVEAARAGKYGKGFAVVAEEVRNLAVKSADSVNETTRMVEETVTNIQQGTAATDATAAQLSSIVEGSGKVASFLEEIAQASREQAQGIDQISEGLEQIDQATQASTASAEESASASEELAGQAQELRSMVAQFSLNPKYSTGMMMLPQPEESYE